MLMSCNRSFAEWVDEYERFLNSDSSKYLKYFFYKPSAYVSDDYYDATSHYSEF